MNRITEFLQVYRLYSRRFMATLYVLAAVSIIVIGATA